MLSFQVVSDLDVRVSCDVNFMHDLFSDVFYLFIFESFVLVSEFRECNVWIDSCSSDFISLNLILKLDIVLMCAYSMKIPQIPQILQIEPKKSQTTWLHLNF